MTAGTFRQTSTPVDATGKRGANPLPITHRVDSDIQHSNGTSVGAPAASGLAQTAQGVNVPDTDGILAPHRPYALSAARLHLPIIPLQTRVGTIRRRE